MTAAEMRDMVRAHLSFDLDGYDSDYATNDTKIDALLIHGYREVSRLLFLWRDRVSMTLTNNIRSYDYLTAFGSKMLQIDEVYIGSNPIRDHRGLPGLMKVRAFNKLYPYADGQTAGRPAAAMTTGTKLVFSRKVDTTTAALTGNSVSGRILAETLTDIPTELHPSTAIYAAYLYARPMASEQEGWQRLEMLHQEALKQFAEARERQLLEVGFIPEAMGGKA